MTYQQASTASEHWLEGAGGSLFVRHWSTDRDPTAAMVICHGFNAHSGHYARTAEALAARGIVVTALDLRGRGRSAGERFYVETFEEYVADLDQAIDFARNRAADLPLFLLGHSAGGVVAATYALDRAAKLSGLICESLAYRVPAPALALRLLKGASHIAPHVPAVRLKLEDFSRDPAWLSVLRADALINNEVEPIGTMAALARANERLDGRLAELGLPLLVMHGTADNAALLAGSQILHDGVSSLDKSLIVYDGHCHDLLNDLDRDRVLNDVGNWVERRRSISPTSRMAAIG